MLRDWGDIDENNGSRSMGRLQYACLIDTDLGLRTSTLPIFVADESNNSQYQAMIGTEIRRISVEEALSIQGLQFTFFKTFHGVYCLAAKVQSPYKTFVYTADTFYDESLVNFCANTDMVIAETSFYKSFTDAKKYGHMNTIHVGTLAQKANIGRVILTHLPHFGELECLAQEVGEIYNGEIKLAYCGMVIQL
jgi:ribonuclease BN (tRNA processing enzyme)